MSELIEQLRAKRVELEGVLVGATDKRNVDRAAFEAREASDSQPTDEEREAFIATETNFQTEFDRREAEIKALDQRIAQEEITEKRRQDAMNASAGTVSVTSEPFTYRRDNAHELSYVRDLVATSVPAAAPHLSSVNVRDAWDRLERHGREMSAELPKRARAREARAAAAVDRAENAFQRSVGVRRPLDVSPFEQGGMEARVNPNRTDGQGGYLVPPVWLISDYIPYLRAGRVAADLCRNMPLPPGTDSINIPKIASGTATAVQTADNAAVQDTDFTDTSVSAGVKTLAGQEDVALQLIEQAPGQIVDQVVLQDLMADYNLKLDAQVLAGTGSTGQSLGILPGSNWTGGSTVTWTSSTPVGNSFNQAVAAAVSKTSYARYDLSNLNVLMHPRRWFWFASALDGNTTGRPIVNRMETGYNVSAIEGDDTPAQGLAGMFPFGPNAYISANVPAVATAGGAITGGSNDLAVVAKWDDLWLFESEMRTRVLPEVLSGTLQVRIQVYNYYAFLVRYGQSIAVIQGTGMAAPAGSIDSSITF